MPPFNKIPYPEISPEQYDIFIVLLNEHIANYLKTIRHKIFNNLVTIRSPEFNLPSNTFIGINLQLN